MNENPSFHFPSIDGESAIELLMAMIEIPSFSREENTVADYLERWIESCGYAVNRTGNNVWMLSPGYTPDKPTILLNSHIDTVKPNAGWQRDPFKAILEEDRLYGLGSNDAGASVVSLLHAYFALTSKEQPYNLIFAATAEEEISGMNGIASLLPLLPPVDFAVVGEPTGMDVAVAEKGLMVLDCVAYGQSGHAAHNTGVNAIYQALPDIEWFRTHQFEKISDWLGSVKMSVTLINAGTQHNVIPDRCSFVVDIRSNDCYSNLELLDEIKASVACEVTPRSIRLSSSHIPLIHPAVEKAIQMGRKSFGSPTLSDMAVIPFPAIKMGPGNTTRSHKADEFIQKQEIIEAIALYIDIFSGLQL
ncbi:MAG: peptidase [Bacteroidetes bacterium]|nr:peptidase [Bacteroidota bacterium]